VSEAVWEPAVGPGALHSVPTGPADPAEVLREQVASTVLGHPGVLRLEPTLLGAVRGLARRSGDGVDGVALVLHGRVADLDVNLATRADHQARASVIELQAQLRDLVTRHGFVPGSIEISVLAVEPVEPVG
jgi:hypothetical protein